MDAESRQTTLNVCLKFRVGKSLDGCGAGGRGSVARVMALYFTEIFRGSLIASIQIGVM
jgi:hypothetical protein